MSDKTCGGCRFFTPEYDRPGRGKCCCNNNNYLPNCSACKGFKRKSTPMIKIILIILSGALALLLAVAGADAAISKLNKQHNELLLDNSRLQFENCQLQLENMLLTDREFSSRKGDQECLE